MQDEFYFPQDSCHYDSISWNSCSVPAVSENCTHFDIPGDGDHFTSTQRVMDKEGTDSGELTRATLGCGTMAVTVNREEGCEEVEGERVVFGGCWKWVAPGEDVMKDVEPKKGAVQAVGVGEMFGHLQRKASSLFDHYAAKRRVHQKYKDAPPSTLTNFPLSRDFPPHPSSILREYTSKALAATRSHIFSCPDFLNINTSSLRHTAMGILADGYRVQMRFVEDVDELAGKICRDGRFESGMREKLAFLEEIEKKKDLVDVCQYSVVSKASSAAKSAVRLFYLELLALKHGTTPSRAQEFVPGFTYEHIQSIDEVIDLIETENDSQAADLEVDQFRAKISKMKPFGARLKPVLSPSFLERLKARLQLL